MAITFIDNDVVDIAGGLDITFTIPAGAQADDFMLAFVKQSENTTQQTWDDDGGGGNGWTRLSYNRTTGGRDQETAIYWKIHSGSESNPTFTWNTSGTTEPMSGTLMVYRGTDTVDPIQDWAFAEAQNDANPPNPTVSIDVSPAMVITLHAATHDDISAVAAPTGFALRSQVWSGTSNDHRNHFTADLEISTVGSYTPPDWQHSVLNTTPEYHTYTIALREPILIGIDDFNTIERFDWGGTSLALTGFGYEGTQGTGKVEIWSDAVGTTKVVQTIDSWSDTLITIDAVQGSLPSNTFLYLVATNDSGNESIPLRIIEGLLAYKELIIDENIDHYWTFDGDYNDTGVTGPTRNATSGVIDGGAFSANVIAEDTTNTWHLNDIFVRREIADSPNMNITISAKERTVGYWLQLNGTQKSLATVWKEGGSGRNLAFITGLGNTLMFQLADVAGTRDNVQAVSGFKLKPNRPYHIVGYYTHLETVKEARLVIDGRLQPTTLTDGNPMVFGNFDPHTGDVTWGNSDTNLETGGTDIAYAGQEDAYMSHFFTKSDNSIGGGLMTLDDILNKGFRRGAIPDDIITSDTEANMQVALDATVDVRPDWPLSYRIESPTSGENLELVFTDKGFNNAISDQIEWRGSGTLTVISVGTTNFDTDKIYSPSGGTINILRRTQVTLTNLPIGVEVRVYENAGGGVAGTEISGIESVTTDTFTFNSDSGTEVIITIIEEGFYPIRDIYIVPSEDISLPIIIRGDRWYLNP